MEEMAALEDLIGSCSVTAQDQDFQTQSPPRQRRKISMSSPPTITSLYRALPHPGNLLPRHDTLSSFLNFKVKAHARRRYSLLTLQDLLAHGFFFTNPESPLSSSNFYSYICPRRLGHHDGSAPFTGGLPVRLQTLPSTQLLLP